MPMKVSGLFTLAVCLLSLFVSGCGHQAPSRPLADDAASSSDTRGAEYRLGTGDRIRLIVFGEEKLSGEFEVDGVGQVSLPLLGGIAAGGRTIPEFTSIVTKRLAAEYLKEPRVSAEILNYRPFYVLGEVKSPGKYPYVSGTSVLSAVALAGGYTYRARESSMVIVRDGHELSAVEDTKVLPGDIVRIAERYF